MTREPLFSRGTMPGKFLNTAMPGGFIGILSFMLCTQYIVVFEFQYT